MSNNSDESDIMAVSRDPADSPSVDEGSCGGSLSGGGAVLKKGPWTAAEDAMLMDYVNKHGEGNWNQVQKHSGLSRCGKSCRLRWANHLRPNLKKGSFSQEEEQKIVELHSKMGNKWARMASHLPGRTDNEIKNYWNTRIKRRQRAGLPLYPPELCQQGSSENQLNHDTSDLGITSDEWQNKLLKPNNCAVPDITFEGYKLDQAVIAFPPNLFEKSVGNLLSQGIGAHNYSSAFTGNFAKRLRGPDTILPSYNTSACAVPSFLQYPSGDSGGVPLIGFNFPYDPDPGRKDLSTLIDEFTGSHAFPNGNFSASTSLVGNAKLELPSLQYPPVHDPCSWLVPPYTSLAETDIMSPLGTNSIQSECMSPSNSGLLDAVLYESQTMGTERSRPTVKASSSSVAADGGVAESISLDPCDTDWEAYDPISPLGCSATSIFSDCTPPNSGSSLEETHNMSGMHVKFEIDDLFLEFAKEKDMPPLDLTRPDALPALGWCKNGTLGQSFAEQSTNLIGEYLSDYRPLQSAASPSCSEGQALGSSHLWNNMPPVCQTPELP